MSTNNKPVRKNDPKKDKEGKGSKREWNNEGAIIITPTKPKQTMIEMLEPPADTNIGTISENGKDAGAQDVKTKSSPGRDKKQQRAGLFDKYRVNETQEIDAVHPPILDASNMKGKKNVRFIKDGDLLIDGTHFNFEKIAEKISKEISGDPNAAVEKNQVTKFFIEEITNLSSDDYFPRIFMEAIMNLSKLSSYEDFAEVIEGIKDAAIEGYVVGEGLVEKSGYINTESTCDNKETIVMSSSGDKDANKNKTENDQEDDKITKLPTLKKVDSLVSETASHVQSLQTDQDTSNIISSMKGLSTSEGKSKNDNKTDNSKSKEAIMTGSSKQEILKQTIIVYEYHKNKSFEGLRPTLVKEITKNKSKLIKELTPFHK